MGKKVYVGNLAFSVTESALNDIFAQHGQVDSCRVITDRDSGRSKGFGFVEMGSDQEAESAIAALNGMEFEGRALTVNEARPQEPRSGGGFGGGSSSSRGGGYGSGGGGGRSSGFGSGGFGSGGGNNRGSRY